MPRTKKDIGGSPKRSEAQKRADKAYSEKNRANNRANQRENFKNISATIKREKAERMAATYKAHGVTVSEILHAAAERLTTDGETAAAQIKADAAAYIARAEGNAQNTATDESQNPNA